MFRSAHMSLVSCSGVSVASELMLRRARGSHFGFRTHSINVRDFEVHRSCRFAGFESSLDWGRLV